MFGPPISPYPVRSTEAVAHAVGAAWCDCARIGASTKQRLTRCAARPATPAVRRSASSARTDAVARAPVPGSRGAGAGGVARRRAAGIVQQPGRRLHPLGYPSRRRGQVHRRNHVSRRVADLTRPGDRRRGGPAMSRRRRCAARPPAWQSLPARQGSPARWSCGRGCACSTWAAAAEHRRSSRTASWACRSGRRIGADQDAVSRRRQIASRATAARFCMRCATTCETLVVPGLISTVSRPARRASTTGAAM